MGWIADRIFKRTDYQITSPYGYRIDPFTGQSGSFHDGVDYGTHREKWNQYGIAKGKVLSCGIDSAYGNAKFVWVQYDELGIKLLYYHLDSISVKKGQEVDENTVIGTTGMTGYATGIHLHLGMKYIGTNNYVNAEEFKAQEKVVRDETKHQVEIIINNLNARDDANGNKLGYYVPQGLYDVLQEKIVEGTRWVQIQDKMWCALLEDCYIEYKPKVANDSIKLKLLSSIEELKKIVEAM